MVFVVKSNAG